MGRDHLGQFMMGSNLGFAKGVQLLEDCEGTCNWVVAGTGGDDVHAFATAAAFRGLNGMQIKTRTTDAAAADYVSVSRYMGWPESGLVVYRLRFALPDTTKVLAFAANLYLRNGVRVYQAGFKWLPNTPIAYYLGAAGAWVEMATVTWVALNLQWVIVEVVVDALSFEYRSVAANGVRVALDGVGLYDAAADTLRGCDCNVQVAAIGANAAEAYFDDVYVGEFLEV